jgi:hypothetical protein
MRIRCGATLLHSLDPESRAGACCRDTPSPSLTTTTTTGDTTTAVPRRGGTVVDLEYWLLKTSEGDVPGGSIP